MKKYPARIIMIISMFGSMVAYGFGGEKENGKEELKELDAWFKNDFAWYAPTHGVRRFTHPYDGKSPLEVYNTLREHLKTSFDTRQSLAEEGACVEIQVTGVPGFEGASALHCAVYMNDTEYVRMLLEYGARNIQAPKNLALPSVFATRNTEILKLLMWYGVVKVGEIEKIENKKDRDFASAVLQELKKEYEIIKKQRKQPDVLELFFGKELDARELSLVKKSWNPVVEDMQRACGLLAPHIRTEKPQTFEEYASMLGLYAIVQQIVKRMDILGIQIKEKPNSNPVEYVVIDQNEDAENEIEDGQVSE